jgi:murein DD-endopeptidase MepM/ murein hydrolase activator NlpD
MQSPIKHSKNCRVMVSQYFGANPAYYAKYNIKGHNGVDLILGYDAQKMYGTDINSVCDGYVSKVIWDEPMSSKGNGVYINEPAYLGQDGLTRYNMWVYWHLMDIDVLAGEVKEGEIIGDMGNSGEVFPKPDIDKPYAGTHLHIALYPCILKDGTWQKEFANNGYDGAIDPLPVIGDLNPEGWTQNNGLNLAELLQPIIWAVNKLKSIIK